MATKSLADRLWPKVDKTSSPDGCWLWTGARNGGSKGGYGLIWLRDEYDEEGHRTQHFGRVHIIGNSMGGHSTVAFALANPARVGKLILMGGGTGGPSQFVAMPTEGIKLLNGLYKAPTLENLKRMMNVFVFDASSITDALMQARLDNMLANREHLENFVKSLAANPKQFTDYGARLGEVAAPTLIVWGREDRFVPMDVGLRLLAGLPNAQLHVFNRCGHWVQWEHADAFNRMVIDFLAH